MPFLRLALGITYAICLVLATASAPSIAQQDAPRFRISYGGSDELCKAQFKLFITRPPKAILPVCAIRDLLPPDVLEANWQEVDILQNLELVQRIEWELRYEISPQPKAQFDLWYLQLQHRMKKPQTRPLLHRLSLSLKSNGPPEFIYGYSTGQKGCDPSQVRSWARFPGMHFFMYDEERKYAERLPVLPGRLVLHKENAYIFSSGLSDRTHFWDWMLSITKLGVLPDTPKNANLYYAPFARNYTAEGICYIQASDMFGSPPRLQ